MHKAREVNMKQTTQNKIKEILKEYYINKVGFIASDTNMSEAVENLVKEISSLIETGGKDVLNAFVDYLMAENPLQSEVLRNGAKYFFESRVESFLSQQSTEGQNESK